MSDFERRLLERSQEIQAERLQLAAEQESQQARETAEAAEAQMLTTKMGKEIVELLQKYEVPSRPIWQRLPSCPYTSHAYGKGETSHIYSNETQYYSYLGEGWEVCDVHRSTGDPEGGSVDMHAGITNAGQVMTGAETYGRVYSDDDHVSGIVAPAFSGPSTTLSYLEDGDFQNGIASLISNMGVYTSRR